MKYCPQDNNAHRFFRQKKKDNAMIIMSIHIYGDAQFQD